MSNQLPRNCPICGRVVPSYFEHVDAQCEYWPADPVGSESVTYRDFEVSRHFGEGWQYLHVDYDGPEDGRCGTEKTAEACYRSIDERLDE